MAPPRTSAYVVGGSALLLATGLLARRLRSRVGREPEQTLVVTVLRTAEEVAAALAEGEPLGAGVEVELRPAPGDRGTEVAVRAGGSRAEVGTDDLRQRLRQLKQQLETGELLRVTPRPEGHRTATPGGLLVDLADRVSGRKGAL